MELISKDAYEELVRDASELERDAYGVKVLLRPDQSIVKLFRTKRILSLSVVYPYSLRFSKNAKRLNRMGIPSVKVERLFFCPSIRRHGVVYPMLEGETLADILKAHPERDDVLEKLAAFMARLHERKIYFRSLHLGNVLELPGGDFGLIDVADLCFCRAPLSMDQRRRNFRHLLRNPLHRPIFEQFGLECFVACYLGAAGLSQDKKEGFLAL